MFTGVTLSTLLSDAGNLLSEVAPIVIALGGVWAASKVIGLVKRIF